MGKCLGVILAISLVILLILAPLVIAASFTSEERDMIKDCKKECSSTKRTERTECKDNKNACKDECKTQYLGCKQNYEDIYDSCKQGCELDFHIQGNESRTEQRQIKRDQKACIKVCSKEKRSNQREFCNRGKCNKECTSINNACVRKGNSDYKECKEGCQFSVFNNNITCEDGKYKPGDEFVDGCEICQCKYSGESECEMTEFCNFPDAEVDEETCLANGGYYDRLCQGPYFRIRCSSDKYCICGGDDGYTCPDEDYVCLPDFIEPKLPTDIPGWKTTLGLPMGDISICAKKPEMPNCGNGTCESMSCDAEGCPEPETIYNCPEDCAIFADEI